MSRHVNPVRPLRRRTLLLSPLAGLVDHLWAAAPGAPRVALVMGNSAYSRSPLPNAANDGRDMARALDALGFQVVQVRDGTLSDMAAGLEKACGLLRGRQGIGLFYFAGHGLQLNWRNFLLPVDALPANASEVPRLSFDTQTAIEAFQRAGARINILVLDACRDNPFGAVASARGLAPMDAPPGTYMAYATAPGNYAEDGTVADGNGLYTRFLLKEIRQPGARIEDVFKRVRLQVRQASQGRQVPWDSSSLEEDFVFATGEQVAALEERQREAAFAAEKADWDRVKDSLRAEDLYEFLRRYPNGSMAELATARLERLERARVTVQAALGGQVQDPGAPRSRQGDRYEFVLRDGLTGLEQQRRSVEVKYVGDDRVEFHGLRDSGPPAAVTAAGAVLVDGVGSYDPPYSAVPGGEFQIGKRWSGRSKRVTHQGRPGWMDYSGRIVARERIDVPAGTLETYRIELEVMFDTGVAQQRTLWVQPDWGLALKQVIKTRTRNMRLDVLVRELVSRQRGA